jgi:hypothetical protein
MMITDDTLQRLVDGELSSAEYQEALLALEDDPSTCESNTWRRCALSFLEAQAFELGAKSWIDARNRGDDSAEVAAEKAALAKNARRKRTMPVWMTLGAMAASLAGAFWVGGLMNDITRPKAPEFVNSGVRQPRTPEVEQLASDGPIFVSFSADDEDEGEFDPDAWMQGEVTPLSPEVQLQWQRRGYTLRTSRRILRTTRLPDGREIRVPFEQYEMAPTAPAPQ